MTADPPVWDERTVMRQRWDELAYLHWRYDPAIVQRLLPPGVTVDTFDGWAWVGLVPFTMRRVQLGPTPPVPWLGTFLEINVRTYVVDPLGRRAVWFLSLDVPRAMVVAVARTAFALPYCLARADRSRQGDRLRYTMTRRWPGPDAPQAGVELLVGAALAECEITALDHFLTARWALLTNRGRRLLRGRVDHAPWPLHRVEEVTVNQNVIQAAGLPAPEGPPLARFSPGVEVRLGRLRAVPIPSRVGTSPVGAGPSPDRTDR